MITLDNDLIKSQTKLLEKEFKLGSKASLLQDDFIRDVFAEKIKEVQYPQVVKIAKPLHRIMQGDLEPEREFVIESPIMVDGSPAWFGNTTSGIQLLGLGYRDGNSRYPCNLNLHSTVSHGVLVGGTGSGKSVANNSIITTALRMYPPWELSVALMDAKVAEFLRYFGDTYPHIRSIGATSDTGFIISALEEIVNEMLMRNAAMAKCGYNSIQSFREGTGLTLDRVLIDIEEFQQAFLDAGRRKPELEELCLQFAKLGRSCGFHLFMSSQETDGVDGNTLKNMQTRIAMGCDPSVSEKVLGNDEASLNQGIPGRGIANLNSSSKESKSHNVNFVVPYKSDSSFYKDKQTMFDLGNKYNFRLPTKEYNENIDHYQKDFYTLIKPLVQDSGKVFLGEPCFIDKNRSKVLSVNITGRDMDNIFICGNTYKNVARHMFALKESFKAIGRGITHNLLVADESLLSLSGLSEITNNKNAFQVFGGQDVSYIFDAVYLRGLLLSCDERIFAGENKQGDLNEFYSKFPKGSDKDTELNIKRYFMAKYLLKTPEFGVSLRTIPGKSYDPETDEMKARVIDYSFFCVLLAANMGKTTEKVTEESFRPVFNWLIGIDKTMYIGRMYDNKQMTALQQCLIQGSRVNIKFITCCVPFDEMLDVIKPSRYLIVDSLDASSVSKTKIPDYPEIITKKQAVFFDKGADEKKALLFKKLLYNDEIL